MTAKIKTSNKWRNTIKIKHLFQTETTPENTSYRLSFPTDLRRIHRDINSKIEILIKVANKKIS